MRATATISSFSSLYLCFIAVACSGSSDGGGGAPAPTTGLACSSTDQCYAGLDAAALKGQAVCLTELQGGYCSHTCTADADCCAIPGECTNGIVDICAPLQSTGQTYCVQSCEASDIPAGADPAAFCRQNANPSFTCRSTGGGSRNRKFCGP